MRFPAFAFAACALSLSACATPPTGDYPSLAVRDGERMSGTIAPPPPEPLPAPPAAALAEADSLRAQAAAAHRDFRAVSDRVGPALRSGDRGARDVALGELMAARSSTMIPLAELDRLYVIAATEGSDATQILAARAEVEAMVAQETATIDAAAR